MIQLRTVHWFFRLAAIAMRRYLSLRRRLRLDYLNLKGESLHWNMVHQRHKVHIIIFVVDILATINNTVLNNNTSHTQTEHPENKLPQNSGQDYPRLMKYWIHRKNERSQSTAVEQYVAFCRTESQSSTVSTAPSTNVYLWMYTCTMHIHITRDMINSPLTILGDNRTETQTHQPARWYRVPPEALSCHQFNKLRIRICLNETDCSWTTSTHVWVSL